MPVLTLRDAYLRDATLPLGTTWLLSDCMESKGKQDLWSRQKPETLAALRERAIIQSVESSNRIEGVVVPAARLQPLVIGRARPRDRSEAEIAGYRRALEWIFTRKGPVTITPEVVRRLHAISQGDLGGDAGQWKRRNNEIIETLQTGGSRVRFVPADAKESPRLVGQLCRAYATARRREQLPVLVLIATFVFDFLCVHPFRDGNGRVSRLLTTLMLQSEGFDVGRYISLERVVEDRKSDYYRCLYTCSEGWHAGKNEMVPWWNYFLGFVRAAYKEWESQLLAIEARPAKTSLVKQAILEQAGDFTLADLMAQVPESSAPLVKKVLGDLKAQGKVVTRGRGRGARWRLKTYRSGA